MSGTLENGDAWFHRWISVETGQSLLQDACQNVALDTPKSDTPESSLTAPNSHAIPFATAAAHVYSVKNTRRFEEGCQEAL